MMMNENSNWRVPVYFVGAFVGAVVGAISAYLYSRTVEEKQPDHRPPGAPSTVDLFKLALTAVGLVRAISDLGSKTPIQRG
jgi:hypothetical protein